MKAIVAFEIEATSVDHIFKLSQKRDKESYKNIVEHLGQRNARAQQPASVMRQNEKA